MDFKNFYLHPEYANQGNGKGEKGRQYWRTWLSAYDHQINADGSIDIIKQKRSHGNYRILPKGYKGNVSFQDERDIKHIPFKFNKVHMDFNISGSGITSLEGCPEFIGGTFNCSSIKINDLTNAPSIVEESFLCNGCGLTSLVGCPEVVPFVFSCESNRITSLEGSPKRVQQMFCGGNANFTSLKGAPEIFEKHPNHLKEPLEFNFRNCRSLDDLTGLPYNAELEYKYDAHKFTKEDLEKAQNTSRIHSHLDEEEKEIFGGVF
jgi:hypothetical protein